MRVEERFSRRADRGEPLEKCARGVVQAHGRLPSGELGDRGGEMDDGIIHARLRAMPAGAMSGEEDRTWDFFCRGNANVLNAVALLEDAAAFVERVLAFDLVPVVF